MRTLLKVLRGCIFYSSLLLALMALYGVPSSIENGDVTAFFMWCIVMLFAWYLVGEFGPDNKE